MQAHPRHLGGGWLDIPWQREVYQVQGPSLASPAFLAISRSLFYMLALQNEMRGGSGANHDVGGGQAVRQPVPGSNLRGVAPSDGMRSFKLAVRDHRAAHPVLVQAASHSLANLPRTDDQHPAVAQVAS